MPAKKNWEDLLDPQKRIEIKLETMLSELVENQVILVVIESEHYSAIQSTLLPLLKKKNPGGIFVSANKPLANLGQNGLSDKNTIFVDMVSETAGIPKVDWPNARYLETPQSLVELSVLIETELKKMPFANKFVILDSLSTLALYNKFEVTERFMHNLTGKLRNLKTLSLILTVRLHENEDLIRSVSQFCDQTVEITENESHTQ